MKFEYIQFVRPIRLGGKGAGVQELRNVEGEALALALAVGGCGVPWVHVLQTVPPARPNDAPGEVGHLSQLGPPPKRKK